MYRVWTLAFVGMMCVLSGGLVGQDTKKDDPKAAKTEPQVKFKGTLPQNWGKIGLTDDQKQEIYKIQGKYHSEIEKLEAKVKELKGTRDKEIRAVLTPDQKKRLEDIVIGKDKDTPKDK